MGYMPFVIVSVLAIIFGNLTKHLIKKMPPLVAEEMSFKEFRKSFFKDFKIDIIYSLIYLILFNVIIYFLGSNVTSYLYIFMALPLMIIFVIDYKYQLIPDSCHIVIAILGIINFVLNIHMWWSFLLAAVIGGGIFLGLNFLALAIFKKEGMGFGDVKLMSALGFFFGIKNTLVITLVSFFLGAIIGGALLIFQKKESDGYIPFGPFIVIATVILMFVPADNIIDIYIAFCSWLGMKMTDGVYFLSGLFNKNN